MTQREVLTSPKASPCIAAQAATGLVLRFQQGYPCAAFFKMQGSSQTGGDHPWNTLSQLDAGSWHSRAYAGEPLPTLDNIAQFVIRNGYALNIEIKPTPGTE